MPRKTAKQIVDEVIAKVEQETAEAAKPAVEHYFRCMTVVAPGSNCNCYASK